MKIHQSLHGYLQGHNLLTSSKKLDNEDLDLMKRLSDWTGFLPHDDEGYLTMYPLPSNNNLYVIAKTWYASEMKRPGCVWTHSIVIDLADIVDGFNFIDLLNLFVRPRNNNYENYSKVIDYRPSKVEDKNVNRILKYKDIIFFYGILCQLNTPSVARIEHKSDYYELLCMTILQFLPIGFIQRATVCTGIRNNRMYTNEPFMLQLSEEFGGKISDISVSSQNSFINQFAGITYICNAIANDNNDTADSLRLFSKDIRTSPQSLNVIGGFLHELDCAIKGDKNNNFIDLYNYIFDSFPASEDGSFVKSVLCGKNVSNLFDNEVSVLSLLATKFNFQIDKSVSKDYAQRVEALTKDEFLHYISLLSDADELNDLGTQELTKASRALTTSDFMTLIENHWTVFYSIATLSPSILYQDFWLNTSSTQFSKIFEIYKSNQSYQFANWTKLYERLLLERVAIPENIFNRIASNIDNAESIYLDYINNQENCVINKAPDIYAASRFDCVMKWLTLQNKLSPIAVQFIINNFSPITQQVKQTNSSVWKVFAESKPLSFNNYYIFLFQLSHNWNDELSIQFLKKSFYAIHTLLANEKLSDNQKSMLAPYYAKVSIWHEWDLCKKLRKGLVKYMHDTNINPLILYKFTPDEKLNNTLIRIWDKTYNRTK